MTLLVLDSGGVSRLSLSSQNATSAVSLLKREGIWPPVVPSIVLVESLSGRQRTDANVNRFLKTCVVVENLPERLARRAGTLRAPSWPRLSRRCRRRRLGRTGRNGAHQ